MYDTTSARMLHKCDYAIIGRNYVSDVAKKYKFLATKENFKNYRGF